MSEISGHARGVYFCALCSIPLTCGFVIHLETGLALLLHFHQGSPAPNAPMRKSRLKVGLEAKLKRSPMLSHRVTVSQWLNPREVGSANV